MILSPTKLTATMNPTGPDSSPILCEKTRVNRTLSGFFRDVSQFRCFPLSCKEPFWNRQSYWPQNWESPGQVAISSALREIRFFLLQIYRFYENQCLPRKWARNSLSIFLLIEALTRPSEMHTALWSFRTWGKGGTQK